MNEVYGFVFVDNLCFVKRAIGIANRLDSQWIPAREVHLLSGAVEEGSCVAVAAASGWVRSFRKT